MKNKENDTFFIIDGYGQIYRSYYAFFSNPLMDKDGRNISAVYGFFNTLLMILRDYKPKYIAVALDSKGKTFRHNLYPEYKANRQKTPEDLHAQIPIIVEMLDNMGIKHFIKEGTEADDVIATIARNCTGAGIKQVIVTGDKDLLQLVSDFTFALRPPRKGEKEYRLCNSDDVEELFGVRPDQICDYLTILGDSSDNVPGISGIGEKGAVKLLKEYDTLSNAYANISVIKGAVKAKLEAARDHIELSHTLIKLKDNLFSAEELDLNSCVSSKINWYKAVEEFYKIDAKSLVKIAKGFIIGDFEDVAVKKTVPVKKEKINSDVPDNFTVELYRNDKLAGYDLKNYIKKKIVEKTVSCDDSLFFDSDEENLKNNSEKSSDKSNEFLNNNNSAALNVDETEEFVPFFDVQIADYLLDSDASEASLDDICLKNNVDINLSEEEKTRRLVYILQNRLKAKGLEDLFYNLEMPLISVLVRMELAGIHLDVSVLEKYEKELANGISELSEFIYSLAGHVFNIASPKQLQEVLFTERGLEPIKKTKSGYSTDSDVLEVLSYRTKDPLPALVLKYRALNKLQSTYVSVLPGMVKENNRIHTTFLQTGTATGRLSSKNPNLQNIPVRTEEGKRIRSAFTAKSGYSLLSADYAQIELAVLASLSQDRELCKSFLNAEDVHKNTASLLFNKSAESVTEEERRIAKTINFGVIYGMSAFRLSGELKISRVQAQNYISTYFEVHKGITDYIEKIKEEASKNGYVKTVLGHIRKVSNINSTNKNIKNAAERIAVNSIIQGTASEIVKKAMLSVSSALRAGGFKAEILLQVHDEIILEVPDYEVEKVKALVKEKMEGIEMLSVPLRVSISVGKNWGDL